MKRREYQKNKKHPLPIIISIIAIILIIGIFIRNDNHQDHWHTAVGSTSSSTISSSISHENQEMKYYSKPKWNRPSEDKPYPDITNCQDLHINVSISKQRVYIMNGNNIIYTMICSSGIGDSTPKGHFKIGYRGTSFFNKKLNEGANYWTAFTPDNVYLFHTVPTTENGDYNISQAKLLGRPASHGCIRLSIPDAKWIYQNIPTGTPVTIN